MKIICSYCGTECGERDQANGRCGSCACFFHGNEEVVEESVQESPTITDAGPTGTFTDAPAAPASNESTGPAPVEEDVPEAIPDNEPDASPLSELPPQEDSEGLIQPRRLSPQFKRRVEMTWQSTLGSGMNAESTLSSSEPSDGTKRESPTLSIATRRISTKRDDVVKRDYQLNEVIGEGSMGRVWSAKQTGLDRNVAVKVPKAELAAAGSVGESQFISEVVVTGQLEHPNIVPIYELGRDARGVPFYSMKHVQGRPWNESIRDRATEDNLEILMKVCDAIAFAHDRNFLHRDIKPHNVMVGEFGEVSVMDWGIAVAVKADPNQPWAATATGPAGTPAYMAPEMAAHNPSELGAVSDIYLLGAVLYEIVTGTPPHPKIGDTGEALLAAAANEIIPTTKTGELVDIARRAMATRPDDRYQTVKEFQDALREYQSHRESIKLCESAEQHYSSAKERSSSDEFARARFAFEEALRLWEGNATAAHGLRVATMDHATNALKQENYELGISILDPENPEHRELLGKLHSKRAGRQRLVWFTRGAVAVAVLAVASVAGLTFVGLQREKGLRVEAQSAQKTAEDAKVAAEKAEETAVAMRTEAETEKVQAEKARIRADGDRKKAQASAKTARQKQREALEASYTSEIGLANESIRRNDFGKAVDILAALQAGTSEESKTKSQLRHMEWGILDHSVKQQTVKDLSAADSFEAVASSQDGRTFAAGSENGTIRLWKESTPDAIEPPTLELELGFELRAIAMDVDGRFLAAAGAANDTGRFTIHVWDLNAENVQGSLVVAGAHEDEVLSLNFSKDGSRILSSAADRTARIWEWRQGREVARMSNHLEKKVWSAAFSPDEQRVVTACDDHRVRVWNLGSSLEKAEYDFRGHEGPVYAAVFSLDGQSVYSGGYDRNLVRWQLGEQEQSTQLRQRLTGEADSRATVSPVVLIGGQDDQHEASIQSLDVGGVAGNEIILSGGNDNSIRIWKQAGAGWSLGKVLRGHGRWVRSCVFTQSQERVLSVAYDGVKRWAWQDYSMPRELSPPGEIRFGDQTSEIGTTAATASVYSPDGQWVATAYDGGTVAVWDMQDPDRSSTMLLVDGHSLLTSTGSFYQDGSRLLTSAADNTTRLWDTIRGTQIQRLEGTGFRGAAAVHWNRDQQSTLIVTGSDDRSTPAWLWTLRQGKPIEKQPLLESFVQRRIDAQLGLGRSANAATTTFVSTDASELTRLSRLKRLIPDVTTVTFAEDGERFLIGNAEGQCFVFQLQADQTPELLATFVAHVSAVRAATFLPSGDVITASVDGQIAQWDVENRKSIRELPWEAPVVSLAVSGDGSRLLVGYAPVDGTQYPAARLFRITDSDIKVEAELDHQTEARDWSIQSIQFTQSGDRALLSLYSPSQSRAGTGKANPYQLGYWDWSGKGPEYIKVSTPIRSQISTAVLREAEDRAELLIVGGKGARLWESRDSERQRFAQLTKSFRPSRSIRTIDFSYSPTDSSTRRLIVGDSEGGIRVWELADRTWSESPQAAAHLAGKHQAELVATTFHPRDPDCFLSADRSGMWKLWKLENGNWNVQQEFAMTGDDPELHCVRFSPDGRRILAGTNQGAKLWSADDAGQFQGDDRTWGSKRVTSAIFSDNGAWIVTFDGDQTLEFWDAAGNPLGRIAERDAKGVTTMALSADRRRFVTGDDQRSIIVWDTNDMMKEAWLALPEEKRIVKELLTLEEHARIVNSVAISPDGRTLLSAGSEGKTIIWAGAAVPLSLSLSRSQATYRLADGRINVDAWAVVKDPSSVARFGGGTFSAVIAGEAFAGETLGLRLTTPGTESLRLDGNTVRYKAHQDAEEEIVGQLIPGGSHRELTVTLSDTATVDGVQTLIRALTYELTITPDSGVREVSLRRRQMLQELAESSRTIAISLSGIQYPNVSQDDRDNDGYEESLTAEFELDLDIENQSPAAAPVDVEI